MDWIEGDFNAAAGTDVAFQLRDEPGFVYYGHTCVREGAEALIDYGPRLGGRETWSINSHRLSRWRLATDLDYFLALYRSFGVELEAKSFSPEDPLGHEDSYTPRHPKQGYQVILRGPAYEESKDPGADRFCGYSGFYGDVVFDLDGRFVEQGFWE